MELKDESIQKILSSLFIPLKNPLPSPGGKFDLYPLKGLGLAPFSNRVIQKDELVERLTGQVIVSNALQPSSEIVYAIGKVEEAWIGLKPPTDSPLSYFRVKQESNLHIQTYLEEGVYHVGLFAKNRIKPSSLLSIDPACALIDKQQVLNALPFIQIETPVAVFDADPLKLFSRTHCLFSCAQKEDMGAFIRSAFSNYSCLPSSMEEQINFFKRWDLKKNLPFGFCYGKLPFGVGIFLSKKAPPIAPDALIGLYAGEVKFFPHGADIEEDLPRHSYAFSILSSRAITKKEAIFLFEMGLSGEEIIGHRGKVSLEVNGMEQGNFTRFINHSRSPNIKYEIYIDECEIYICLITNKMIQPGKQILLNYGLDYWKNRSFEPFPLNPSSYTVS